MQYKRRCVWIDQVELQSHKYTYTHTHVARTCSVPACLRRCNAHIYTVGAPGYEKTNQHAIQFVTFVTIVRVRNLLLNQKMYNNESQNVITPTLNTEKKMHVAETENWAWYQVWVLRKLYVVTIHICKSHMLYVMVQNQLMNLFLTTTENIIIRRRKKTARERLVRFEHIRNKHYILFFLFYKNVLYPSIMRYRLHVFVPKAAHKHLNSCVASSCKYVICSGCVSVCHLRKDFPTCCFFR